MKRSEINLAIKKAKELLSENKFYLPEFSEWTIKDWKENNKESAMIVRNGLGWDITDFGLGRFYNIGATIFTIRNDRLTPPRIGLTYAEKIIILEENQIIPMHFHFTKTEDIINRGNGVLCVKLFNCKEDESIDTESDVTVWCDGIQRKFSAGEEVDFLPGRSITISHGLYHSFWAKEGAGALIAGEVSALNDDKIDNRFAEPVSRFAQVVEDELADCVLCNEYERLL